MKTSIGQGHISGIHIEHVNPVVLQRGQHCLHLRPTLAKLFPLVRLPNLPHLVVKLSPARECPRRAPANRPPADSDWHTDGQLCEAPSS